MTILFRLLVGTALWTITSDDLRIAATDGLLERIAPSTLVQKVVDFVWKIFGKINGQFVNMECQERESSLSYVVG